MVVIQVQRSRTCVPVVYYVTRNGNWLLVGGSTEIIIIKKNMKKFNLILFCDPFFLIQI